MRKTKLPRLSKSHRKDAEQQTDRPDVNWERYKRRITADVAAPDRGVSDIKELAPIIFPVHLYLWYITVHLSYSDLSTVFRTFLKVKEKKVKIKQLGSLAPLTPLWGVSKVQKIHLCCLPHYPWAQSLSVERFGTSVRVVGSVLGRHFLHPGHVPVPNRLWLPVRLALCVKRWVQDAEWGRRWRKVWT